VPAITDPVRVIAGKGRQRSNWYFDSRRDPVRLSPVATFPDTLEEDSILELV
jgi:hypothetical protein